MKKFLFFPFMLFLCFAPIFGQSNQNANFPSGSINGRTEMGTNTAPLTIPNVDINITSPRTGQEVAFSVRLLLLMTVLTLAPSLLILLTCFLRFSIVLDFIKKNYVKYVFHASRDTRFALATLGNDAGIFGSAKLVLDGVARS